MSGVAASSKVNVSSKIRLCRNMYIIGPQSTGKTTLVNAIALRLGGDIPIIQEVARTVMQEKGYSRIDVDSDNRDRRFSLQKDIFIAQAEKEVSFIKSGICFVSDRSAIDPLVYLMHYSGSEELERITSTYEWREVRDRYADTKECLVVLLLPVVAFLVDDSVRYMAKSLEDWHTFASNFRRFMREQGIPFTEMGEDCLDIEERVARVVDLLST
jgi:nicotinamide riboside kinase